VAIHIGSGETDFWNNNPPAAGSGVRFTSSDGTTLLKFEVESYDTTNDDGWWHVKVPTLSASVNTDIYIYYDATTETSGEDINNTWDANFKAVYHLNQDKAAGAFADSTVNANTLTNSGTTDSTGQIDKVRSFDGINDSMNAGNNLAFGPGDFTLAFWIKFTVFRNYLTVFSTQRGSTGWNLGSQASAYLVWYSSGAEQIRTANNTFALNTWYHVAFVRSGTTLSAYVDGTVRDTATVSTNFTAAPMRVGTLDTTNSEWFAGSLDEVIVSNVSRSADWIKARYQSGLGTWLTIAAMETSGGGAVTVPWHLFFNRGA